MTGVLKYWQDRTMAGFTTVGVGTTSPIYGFNADRFTADISDGGSFSIVPDNGSDTLAIKHHLAVYHTNK